MSWFQDDHLLIVIVLKFDDVRSLFDRIDEIRFDTVLSGNPFFGPEIETE